jgi:hypothetical protein
MTESALSSPDAAHVVENHWTRLETTRMSPFSICAVRRQQLPGQWLLYGFRVGPEQLRAWLRIRDDKWDDARPKADHQVYLSVNGYLAEQGIGSKAVALFDILLEGEDIPAEPRFLLVCWAHRIAVGRKAPLPEDKRGVLAMARYWRKGM